MFEAFRNWFSHPTEAKYERNVRLHSTMNGSQNEGVDVNQKTQIEIHETVSSTTNTNTMSTEVSNLSPELIKKAKEELNEIPERRSQDIEIFRKMVLTETNLHCPLDDAFLLRFLRARKFNHERAFHLLRHYYQMRVKYPELYINFRPSAMMHVFERNMCKILPHRDQDGRRVIIIRPGIWRPTYCSEEDAFSALQIYLENIIKEEETQINGVVTLLDVSNLSFLQIKHFAPWAKRIASLCQDFIPLRIKGINYIFESIFLDVGILLFKPFLSKKLRNRIFCHGSDLNSLHRNICREILPEEYGGNQPSMDNMEYIQSLLDCEDEFVKNAIFGYQTNLQEE